jgi:hypothetical protein
MAGMHVSSFADVKTGQAPATPADEPNGLLARSPAGDGR